ncbi:MAG: oligosaccharide flippase family protein [candidate division Zixibacteria bacterium]|nr:oligosaccharide flippase family protein [candidate division Zixibacteria bacterium]
MKEKLTALFRQSFVYTIGSLSSPIMGIFMVPIYTRVFSPEDYGVIDLIQITIIFASVALIMGTDNATGRYYLDKDNESDKKAIASTSLFFRAVILFAASGLFVLFSEEISLLLFKSGKQSGFLLLAFVAIPFDQCFTLCLNLLRYNFRSVSYTVIGTGKLLSKISLAILLVVFLKWGITGVFAATLISSTVFLLIILIFIRKYLSLSFSTSRLKELLTYGLPLMPYGFTVYLIQNCSRYFLVHYSTLQELGLYAVSSKLATLISFVFIGVGAALGPFLFSGYKKDETKAIYLKVVNYSIAASVVAVLGLSLFAREILMIFTSGQYVEAYILIPFLSSYITLFYLGLQMSWGIHIIKKTIYFTVVSIITAVVNIGLSFWLVPQYGMMGAAVTSLASSVVWCVSLVYISQKCYRINYDYLAYIKIAFSTTATILIAFHYLPDVNWQNTLLKIAIIMVSVVLLYFFKVIDKSELRYLKSLATIFTNRKTN